MLYEENKYCLNQILKLIKDIYHLKSASIYLNTPSRLKLISSEPVIRTNDTKILEIISAFNRNQNTPYYKLYLISIENKKTMYLLLESFDEDVNVDHKIKNFLSLLKVLNSNHDFIDKEIDEIKYFMNLENTTLQDTVKMLGEKKNIFHFLIDFKENRFCTDPSFYTQLGIDKNLSCVDLDLIKQNIQKRDEYEITIQLNRLINNEITFYRHELTFQKNDKFVLNLFFLQQYEISNEKKQVHGFVFIKPTKNYFQTFINKNKYGIDKNNEENFGIWEYDYINKELLFCSTALKILGIDKSKIKLYDFISINPEKNYSAVRSLVKNLKSVHLDEITDFQSELEIVNFSGEEKYLDVIGKKIRENQVEPIIIGVIKDVTVEVLKNSSDLQLEKLQSLGSLAGSIAHDFNNILMASFGYIGMLKNIPNMPKQALDYINSLDSVSRSAAVLAKRLLTFSRTDKYSFEAINLVELLKETIEVLKHLMPPNISISVNYNVEKAYVMGNTTDIQNALMNIAINAKDAMPNGGLLNFKISTEYLHELDPTALNQENFMIGEYVVIDITDTGMGIKKEDNSRIFEPFYTTKGKNQGTGLGLSTVLKTVKKTNGLLKFTSVVNAGTIFSIYLPLTTEVSEAEKTNFSQENITQLSDKIPHYNIMVVDDEEIVRTIVVEALESIGLTVHGFGHPVEAIRFYSENYSKIDLVILDMMMPIMSGEDTFNNLKQINPDILAIILSGFSSEGMVNKMLNNGAIGYLEKPISIEELCFKVVNSLQNRPVESILNENLALSTLANNKRVYSRLLARYYEEYNNINYTLEKKLNLRDYTGIRGIIHKIKGVSLNLGAEELLARTEEIENKIMNNELDNIVQLIDEFIKHHDLVLEQISHKLNR